MCYVRSCSHCAPLEIPKASFFAGIEILPSEVIKQRSLGVYDHPSTRRNTCNVSVIVNVHEDSTACDSSDSTHRPSEVNLSKSVPSSDCGRSRKTRLVAVQFSLGETEEVSGSTLAPDQLEKEYNLSLHGYTPGGPMNVLYVQSCIQIEIFNSTCGISGVCVCVCVCVCVS